MSVGGVMEWHNPNGNTADVQVEGLRVAFGTDINSIIMKEYVLLIGWANLLLRIMFASIQ